MSPNRILQVAAAAAAQPQQLNCKVSPAPAAAAVHQPAIRRSLGRTYDCRVCGMALSSASNRIRHERSKHPSAAAAAAVTTAQPPPIIAAASKSTVNLKRTAAAAALEMNQEESLPITSLMKSTESNPSKLQLAAAAAVTSANLKEFMKDATADSKTSVIDGIGEVVEQETAMELEPGATESDQQLLQVEDAIASDRRPAAASICEQPDSREIQSDETISDHDTVMDPEQVEPIATTSADPADEADRIVEAPVAEATADHAARQSEDLNRMDQSKVLNENLIHSAADHPIHDTSSRSPLSEPSPHDDHDPDHDQVDALAARDAQLQAECLPFLQWMCQPPITQVEALVKARRVKLLSQLSPIKLNLRFILGMLLQQETIEAPELRFLTRLPVCQALLAALEQRQVGSARVHAIFLLVKKVLVYFASRESSERRQFITPASHESYMYVESICSDSSYRRKQEARNRAMLGAKASQLLHKSQPTAGRRMQPLLSADAFVMPSMQGPGNVVPQSSRVMPLDPTETLQPRRHQQVQVPAEDPEPSPLEFQAQSDRDSPSSTANELTGEELKAVASGALAYLKLREPAFYMHHLATATLCLGLAPRSQVLKQLRLGSSFVKQADGRYWVKMLAELNKNGKPTVFALPKELTEPYDWYVSELRPRLLHGEEHDYVFFKRNGTAPRADFSELTATATQQLIGRPVNPHAFRSAVITAFYEAGATQSEMDVLATIMAHDPATARSYYFKPQMAKAAVTTGDRMLETLKLV